MASSKNKQHRNPRKECALVTGGSHGIGKCLAKRLAAKGYSIILVALDDIDLPKTRSEILHESKVNVWTIGADLTRKRATERILQEVKALDLKVSILVNNAGLSYVGGFDNFSLDYYRNLVTLNSTALMELTYLFLPLLKENKKAYILNIASVASMFPVPYKAVYTASKHFVLGLSLALHEELKDYNISVTSVCPSGVVTSERSRLMVAELGWLAKSSVMTPDAVARESLEGLFNEKRNILPGSASKLYQIIQKVLPYQMMMKIVLKQIRKTMRVKTKLEQTKKAS
jgi:short-subunit dehydrogenase